MGKMLKKWDPDRHCYDPYECPDDWKVCGLAFDMDAQINCACCGKQISYEDGYTSREIYDSSGMFGMCICPDCNEAQWGREKERRKKTE